MVSGVFLCVSMWLFGSGALFDTLVPRNGMDPSYIANLQTVFLLFRTLPGENCPVT